MTLVEFLRARPVAMRAGLATGLPGGPALVDVQAKLRMVDLCEQSERSADPGEAALAEDILRLLARPWSFEPDYDDRWRKSLSACACCASQPDVLAGCNCQGARS